MSHVRFVCLLVHTGVQHILCCLAFRHLVRPVLSVSLDCPFLMALSVYIAEILFKVSLNTITLTPYITEILLKVVLNTITLTPYITEILLKVALNTITLTPWFIIKRCLFFLYRLIVKHNTITLLFLLVIHVAGGINMSHVSHHYRARCQGWKVITYTQHLQHVSPYCNLVVINQNIKSCQQYFILIVMSLVVI